MRYNLILSVHSYSETYMYIVVYLYLMLYNIISFEQGNKQLYQVPNTNEEHWC